MTTGFVGGWVKQKRRVKVVERTDDPRDARRDHLGAVGVGLEPLLRPPPVDGVRRPRPRLCGQIDLDPVTVGVKPQASHVCFQRSDPAIASNRVTIASAIGSIGVLKDSSSISVLFGTGT